MKQRMKVVFSIFMSLAMLFSFFPATVQAATTLTSNATGTIDGYNYEYWKDNGTGTMTLNGGGTFSCSWSNINNILFRTGKKLGSTKTYQEYGNISIDYSCNYQPNGNSYMAVYGWTEDPLVEYYIIDSYGTWKPPGNGIAMKGTVTVDGRTYEIYQNSRTGPSIKGNTTFQQYWSICTSKRTSGTISVSEHFKAWEAKGMKMGKMYEVSMVVEGYQSSGKADMTKMNLNVGGPAPSTQPSTQPSIKPSTQPSVQPSGSTNNQPLRVLAEKIRAKGHEFYVGAAIPGNFSSSDQDIVKKEFDIVTCENNMKIGTISPSRGQYNYSGGDSLVNFAKANDMVVHGHAFVWHKYNPGWVDGTKSMMESYINAVGTHYKGKIYAWDVVNEAFQKDGTYRINAIGSNGQDGASVFGQKQGKQYIEDAFIAARKADPNAKLVYNEYDLETRPAKFDGVYAMVKDFKSRNIPIDGVGFQMHLGPSFTEADAQRFADQMQKLADIGVESYVTEMDVGCSDTTQAGLAKQAEIYGWIAKACAEQPYCRALQVWGIRDSQSWRINPDSPEDRAIAPLIFNDNGQKKPAYYAIQKALADALNSSSIPNPTTPPITVPSLKGDLNDDGIINMADVLLVATSFNATPSFPKYNAAFDLNEDGAINMADVLIIAQNFNKPVTKTSSNPTTKAPPTPTPTKAVSPTVSKNPNAKLLALTFDDGPDNTLTAKVLDKLDKYKVPATFMMIGQKVNSGTSAIIKRIVDSGHEIGNHSWGYDNMGGMSSSAIKDSISKTQAAIKQYAGVTPKFFRAPNLNYSQTLYDAVDLTFVQGVTCNDWSTSTSAADRANAIIAGARDGTILLMHDVQPLPHPTPEALDILIPKLQSQGYEFVTLSELFERKGVALRANDNIAHTTLPN